ncbi:chitooligosaccharide synthase NodC [Streptomyces sp. B21-108]|uniref:chitooligosaccharide synthase NodC n=1 Tax=Streptomyces sp. B21-108 TaxID=3039419 RepID=UPI002FF2AE41
MTATVNSILSDIVLTVSVSYVLLAVGYQAVQACYAWRADHHSPAYVDPMGALPSVDVIIPCYNEDPLLLAQCLGSVLAQDYEGQLRVYLVDDGSSNRSSLEPVYAAYADDPRFTFLPLPHNVGKRKAQVEAIRRSGGELVLNVDSDTTIEPGVVRKLAAKMADPAVGGAMGRMVAGNRHATWLTRLVDMEYWMACNGERAAQAEFGAVMCCCGPCAVYRRSILLRVLDQYETQYFRGRPSDFGEDRHLTVLMLKEGMRTEYVPDARAATLVPERLRPYARQQLRWARSTFRDTALVMRLLPRLGRYLVLDAAAQNLAPLLLALTVLTGCAQIATGTVPWAPILAVTAASASQCAFALWTSREARFFGMALHTALNIFLLLPLKVYALCTLSDSSWGSRNLPTAAPGGRGDDLPGNPPPARAVTDALSGVHSGIPRQATERPGREASKEGEPGWTVGSAWRS